MYACILTFYHHTRKQGPSLKSKYLSVNRMKQTGYLRTESRRAACRNDLALYSMEGSLHEPLGKHQAATNLATSLEQNWCLAFAFREAKGADSVCSFVRVGS